MDRLPLPPPFAKGTTLRYKGRHRSWTQEEDGNDVAILEYGMVVTVDRTHPGHRGTLLEIVIDVEDGGDFPLDETVDGYSTYSVEVPGYRPAGRIIWPKDAAEWEVVE